MIDRAEVRDRAFKAATGMFPPGRDVPSAMGGSPMHDSYVRGTTWSVWIEAHGKTIDRVLDAVEAILREDAE